MPLNEDKAAGSNVAGTPQSLQICLGLPWGQFELNLDSVLEQADVGELPVHIGDFPPRGGSVSNTAPDSIDSMI